MWAHHGDYQAERNDLHVEPYVAARETPRPDFYLSAAKAPYAPYQELTDPALLGYYARPRRRKILLQHGIIHPHDYRRIFGSEHGEPRSTHETLMRVNRLLKSRMKEPKAERELLPYLPDAMKRLLRAGLKMEDKAVEAAKNEMMSRPLDYVIIRLEEQLRAVKHALYLQKQPTVAKNMEKFGFTGFVHNGKPDDPDLPAKIHALEREEGAVERYEERMHKANASHLKGTRTERMMAKSDYNVQHHVHEGPPPGTQPTDPKAREEQHKQRHQKAETQTLKHKGVATDKDEKEAQTTGKVETADKQHQGKEVKATPKPPFRIKTTKKHVDRVATVKRNKEKEKAKEWHPPEQKKIEGTPFWLRSKEKRPKSAPAISEPTKKEDEPEKATEGEVATTTTTAKKGKGKHKKKAAVQEGEGGASTASEAQEGHPEQTEGESHEGKTSSTAEGTVKSSLASGKSRKTDHEGVTAENTSEKRKRTKSKKASAGSHSSAPSVQPKNSSKHLLSSDEVPNTTHDAMASDLTAFGKLSPPQTISDVGFDLPRDDTDHARAPPTPVDEAQMKLEHEAAQYNPQSMRKSLRPELTETLDAEHPNEPKQSDPLETPPAVEQPPPSAEETPASPDATVEPEHQAEKKATLPPVEKPAEELVEQPVEQQPPPVEQHTEQPVEEHVMPETEHAENPDASHEPPADQNPA